jgi:hypothetical protein
MRLPVAGQEESEGFRLDTGPFGDGPGAASRGVTAGRRGSPRIGCGWDSAEAVGGQERGEALGVEAERPSEAPESPDWEENRCESQGLMAEQGQLTGELLRWSAITRRFAERTAG